MGIDETSFVFQLSEVSDFLPPCFCPRMGRFSKNNLHLHATHMSTLYHNPQSEAILTVDNFSEWGDMRGSNSRYLLHREGCFRYTNATVTLNNCLSASMRPFLVRLSHGVPSCSCRSYCSCNRVRDALPLRPTSRHLSDTHPNH